MAANLSRLGSPEFLKVLKEGSKALRELKKVDPRDRYVVLYPDSDCAHVGMGFNSLTDDTAEDAFNKASKILDKDLLKLCLKGPKNDLIDTLETRSLATYVSSHARMLKFVNDRPNVKPLCKAAAGIGVGFVNALVFAEAITFENGLDLVQRRAQAMEKANSIVPGAKLIIHLKPATSKRKLCRTAVEHCLKQDIPPDIAVCSVTKQIRPQLIEVGGHEEAIRYLEQEGSELFEFISIKRLVHRSNAFHTDLMKPASDFLAMYIKQRTTEEPDYLREPQTCSVYSATSGCRLRDVKSIKKDLYNSPTQPLQIEQLLQCLYRRPQAVAQPNTLVVDDRYLLRNLLLVNRKAWDSAKLLRA